MKGKFLCRYSFVSYWEKSLPNGILGHRKVYNLDYQSLGQTDISTSEAREEVAQMSEA
jgi:hypothetical protein